MAPERLARSNSFLGIHFDFHAGYDCKEVGGHVTEEMVERIIDQVKPDYIQCDCKGHRGISSYPTKVGHPAPGFEKDQLRIWRSVTERRGVSLFMHFSGVWDTEVVTRYPELAVIQADGKPSIKNTSFFESYVDTFLIPQLKELRDVYGVDGVWVDGECWSTEPDYSEKAAAAFRKATGIADLPLKPGSPNYPALMEFTRANFRRYLAHYVDELHRHDRGFQIASNWAYSSQMPEPVEIDVDYISGDYSLKNSVNAARFEARCMMYQGKPWDLMAWSFAADRSIPNEGNNTKTAVQLKQEAASTIMLGGGFQAYFKQKRDGSINPWTMSVMADVAEFCRDRQEFCHKAEPVPQVALLYSRYAFYRKHPKPFGNWGVDALKPLGGVLKCLLETQYVTDVCMEHHLTGRMGEYPLIVVPEWDELEQGFRDELTAYVKDGGSLLLVGQGAAKLFSEELGITFGGNPGPELPRFLAHDGRMAPFTAAYEEVGLGAKAHAVGSLFRYNDMEYAPLGPAAVTAKLGKGKIGAILFPLGAQYLRGANPLTREFLRAIVNGLFTDPAVKVTGSMYVDVSLMKKDGALCVNLVNTAGPHADPAVHVYDEIPKVGPLTVEVAVAAKPESVSLQPGNRGVSWSYGGGKVTCTVESLEIHDIVVIR